MAEDDRPVISNTTPLIVLAGVGLLDLLPQLYGTVTIPQSVLQEYLAGVQPGEPEPATMAWVRITEDVPTELSLPSGLGAGEAAAIRLAASQHARAILLDDHLARRVALQHGLPVVGTLGVLLAAKQRGLLTAVKPILDEMVSQGRHISEGLRRQALELAGESEE